MSQISVPVTSGTAGANGRDAAPTPAYLAVPSGDGPWPGAVVIHEAFGLNDDIRRQADRLAAAGYLALAPDLLGAGSRLACIRRVFGDLSRRSGPTFERLEALRQFLADHPDSTGRVGVVGFCMGGGFALLLAPREGWSAASVNYGMVPKDVDALVQGACPVVGSYGRKDRMLRGHAERLAVALTTAGVPHDVHEYPQAGHSFLNQSDGVAIAALGKVTGAGYEPATAADAWHRIEAFLGEHLAGQPGPSVG